MKLASLLALAIAVAPSAVERADAAWAEERYADAAVAYADAYAETGDIAYLFARGRAEQASGDCAAAIETYEIFIATKPLPKAVAAAQASIDECRALLPEPEPQPEPDPAPLEPEPEPRPDPVVGPDDAAPTERPWQRDPTAALLMAFGAAGLATGTALTVAAYASQDAAERASDVVDFGHKDDRARTLEHVAIPVFIVGGALVIGGAIRYGLLARKHERRNTAHVRLDPGLRLAF